MFGKNPIRKQKIDDGQMLRVQEIFKTVQGEGPHAGRPAFFIRLAGCNLRCYFCDTDFESRYDNKLTPTQIMQQIGNIAGDSSISLVVITGGEPLLQNIAPLIKLLRRSSFDVQIETAGTVWLPELEQVLYFLTPDALVCSPKTGKLHPRVAALCSHWKYIASDTNLSPVDGLPDASTQKDNDGLLDGKAGLFRPNRDTFHTIWLQPMDAGLDTAKTARNTQAAINSCLKHGYRLSIQIHKTVGLP